MTESNNIEKKGSPLRAVTDLLNYSWIVKNIGFFLFLAAMAVFYIANGHKADNCIRKINETGRQLKDLQYEYKTLKSEMMFKSKETELVKAAAPMGLAMDSIPPLRIQAVTHEN